MKLALLSLLLVVVACARGARRVPRQYHYEPAVAAGDGVAGGHLASVAAGSLAYNPPYRTATCKLIPASGQQVGGDILFHQPDLNGPVEVTGTVFGLAPGLHGFHVHQFGNVSEDCKASGSHFNPDNNNHGGPGDAVRHAGDLGNIAADGHGYAHVHILDGEISLVRDNPRLVVGRAVVVHGKEDDFGKGNNDESLKTGNAGPRVACCVIEATKYDRK